MLLRKINQFGELTRDARLDMASPVERASSEVTLPTNSLVRQP